MEFRRCFANDVIVVIVYWYGKKMNMAKEFASTAEPDLRLVQIVCNKCDLEKKAP